MGRISGGLGLDGRRRGADAMTLALCGGGTVDCTCNGSSERMDEERSVLLSGPSALSACVEAGSRAEEFLSRGTVLFHIHPTF